MDPRVYENMKHKGDNWMTYENWENMNKYTVIFDFNVLNISRDPFLQPVNKWIFSWTHYQSPKLFQTAASSLPQEPDKSFHTFHSQIYQVSAHNSWASDAALHMV